MTSENTPRPVTVRSCAWPDCGCAVPIKCPLQQEADAGEGLVERLRELTPEITGKSYYWGKLIKEAADTIAALQGYRAAWEKIISLQTGDVRKLCNAAIENEALRQRIKELESK